jgi:hypothetical protein
MIPIILIAVQLSLLFLLCRRDRVPDEKRVFQRQLRGASDVILVVLTSLSFMTAPRLLRESPPNGTREVR